MLSASQLSRLFEDFPNIDSVASATQSLTYLGRILLHNRDLHGETATQKCQEMISDHPELHTVLKDCYNAKDFAPLLISGLFCSLRTFRLPQTMEIEKFLEELRPAMLQVVRGERDPILRWSCQAPVNEADKAHIESLQIPVLYPEGDPILLLHRLGTFRDDAVLQERLNNIFNPGTHTFLINTSGSGKTRLLFEGLCQHWGMYFTSHLDKSRLGSADLGSVYANRFEYLADVDNQPPRSSAASTSFLEQNLRAARRAFGEPMLARLLLFKLFLTLMHETGPTEEHKRRWLMVQISFDESLSRHDGFLAIIRHLRGVDDAYIDDWINELLPHVGKLCGLSSTKDSLFFAIDEINSVVGRHTDLFTELSEDGEVLRYPLLKVLFRSWRERTKEVNATLVIAGTALPKQFFGHRPGEWTSFHWCSDTGGFEDPDSHKQYVSAFLPPQYRASPSGKHLIRRMWYWLRGRHRATATCITLLLSNGFRCPHRVLDDFVYNATTFKPTDGEKIAQEEPDLMTSAHDSGYRSLNYGRLQQDALLRLTVQEVLLHYLITAEHPGHFDDSRIIAVTYGMGRFVDTESRVVAMNEPLDMTGAVQWFAMRPNSLTDFSYLIDAGSSIPQRPHSIAPYIALYIVHAVEANPLLSDIFTFAGKPPAWATQIVELVSVRRTKTANPRPITRVVRATDMWKSSTPLATRAKSSEQTISWIEHSTSTPFCIPSSPNSDLIFVLRLADKRLVWVVVRCRVLEDANELKTTDLKDIMTGLLPQNMFRGTDVGLRDAFDETNPTNADVLGRLKALPNRCADAGPYSILRVVASFPAQSRPSTLAVSREDSIPIAVLNTTKLQEVIDSISPIDVKERLISTVIGIRKPDVAPVASPPAKRQLQPEEPLSRNTRSRTLAAVKESAAPPTARRHNTRNLTRTTQEKEPLARRPRHKK